MSDAAVGVLLALVLAPIFLVMIIWQFKSRKFVDPIFSAFAPESWSGPLLWFTAVFYGFFAIVSLLAGLNLLMGK